MDSFVGAFSARIVQNKLRLNVCMFE
jgi:hypothetical protein